MGILDLGRYKGIVFAITGFLVFIAIILAVNHGKAGQFSDDVSAVKFLAEQREQPAAVYTAGRDLAARLKNGQSIDEPLEALRKAAKSHDTALSGMSVAFGQTAAENVPLNSPICTAVSNVMSKLPSTVFAVVSTGAVMVKLPVDAWL